MKKLLFIFAILAACSPEKSTSSIADLKPFFQSSLNVDSITGTNTGLNVSFYKKQMSFLGFQSAKGNVSKDSGSFYVINLINKTKAYELKNTYYAYMNLNSFLYQGRLYFGESTSFPSYHYFDLVEKKSISVSNGKPYSHNKIAGGNFEVKGDLFFFEGHPFGPGILNTKTFEIFKNCDGRVMSPSYAVFAKPLDSALNIMLDCRDSLNNNIIKCICVDNDLKEVWSKDVHYEAGRTPAFFRAINTGMASVLCYGESITALDRASGKILWEKDFDKTAFECIEKEGTLFVFEKQKQTETTDSIYVTAICSLTGEVKLPVSFIGIDVSGLAQGFYSYNEDYIFISLGTSLSVYRKSDFSKLFSRKYKQPVFLSVYKDGYDNKTYTVVDGHVFW